jgi:radical SAM protein with 4Fe4S-binding SPASM domain
MSQITTFAAPLMPAAPLLVVWEAWRDRTPAHPWRDDLSTLEGMRLLNEIRCFGRVPVLLVGRPLRRTDLGVLVEHGSRIGLGMRLDPGFDQATPHVLADLRDAGLQRMRFDIEDDVDITALAAVRDARAVGLGVDVLTRITAEALPRLGAIADAIVAAGAHTWTISFYGEDGSAPVKGSALDHALRGIVAIAETLPLQVEVDAAPQLHRVLQTDGTGAEVRLAPADGEGVLYVAADGALQPSSRLAIRVGNARGEDLVDVFREAGLLQRLRDRAAVRGKCAVCEYRDGCGGSRARAWAATGDAFTTDPACSYLPPAWSERARA